MTAGSDVLVVGAGAAGAAVARALAAAGATVTVVRPAEMAGEAWRAAAGMLAAQIETGPNDPLFKLGVAGRAHYRREAERLHSLTGIDVGLRPTGILQVALSDTDAERYKAKVAWQRQQAESAEWLDPDDVHEQWPWLARGSGAFWAPDDGTIDPRALVEAELQAARLAGATVVTDRIHSLNREGSRLVGMTGEHGCYPATHVVLAAGAWSGRIASLPRPLSVEPVRGQMAAYPWPADVPAITVYGSHCYLLHRGSELWTGSTMEHAGFSTTTTAEALADVAARVSAVYPGLATERPLRTWAGLRPGTPDGYPIIGEEPRLRGLWYATGYGRNGILLSGITGTLLAQSIAGEPLPDDLRAFAPERFWSW
jgi:glycine oxidase